MSAEACAMRLHGELDGLTFTEHVYNPLDYAWPAHREYLRRFANGTKRVLFLGMNAGPFGMVQTGVPFGEVAAVRDWMAIEARFDPPARQHSRRPVHGFDCQRSEVSGRRLWGLARERYGSADDFFAVHAVVNYCPLAFLDSDGRNRTPDKLAASERKALYGVCDRHLRDIVGFLRPEWLIGVGGFAADRAQRVLGDSPVKIGRIQHPSPANPRANRDWAGQATAELRELGVWD